MTEQEKQDMRYLLSAYMKLGDIVMEFSENLETFTVDGVEHWHVVFTTEEFGYLRSLADGIRKERVVMEQNNVVE